MDCGGPSPLPSPQRGEEKGTSGLRDRNVDLPTRTLELFRHGVHAGVLGAPFVERGVTEAVFAPDLFDRHAGLGLAQEANDLFFAEFTCSHVHHSRG
jgi:hypothetical protein